MTSGEEVVIGNSERRYSDKEFAVILRRAFELQERPSGVGTGEGLTLGEIQAIAREVGLDPALVERAASVLPTAGEGRAARVFGGPDAYQLEYSASGEVPKEDFAKLVDAIRRATGHQGEATEVLGSLEWKTVGQVSQVHVTVSRREGRTHVRVIADRGGAAFLTYFVSTFGWLVGMGISGAVLEPSTAPAVIALVAAAVGGAFVTARTLWKTTTSRFRSQLSNLMGGLTRAVDESLGDS